MLFLDKDIFIKKKDFLKNSLKTYFGSYILQRIKFKKIFKKNIFLSKKLNIIRIRKIIKNEIIKNEIKYYCGKKFGADFLIYQHNFSYLLKIIDLNKKFEKSLFYGIIRLARNVNKKIIFILNNSKNYMIKINKIILNNS